MSHSMIVSRILAGVLAAGIASVALARESAYPWQPARSYALESVDQFDPTPSNDVLPKDPAARGAFARALAMDAVIYGLPAAYQYREMFAQALDRTNPRYVGMN